MQKLRKFCLVFWQIKKTTFDGQILKLENCYATHTLFVLSITETFSINRIVKTTEAALRQSGRELKVSNVLITSLALPQQLVWRHTPTTPGITCWAGIQLQSADKVIDYNIK